jgi:2-oxoisovalerate dehydrogenase E1 component alpha subunit
MATLDTEHLIELYRTMALARALDERLWQMNRQGITHFAVPCAGHEAVGAAYVFAMKRGHDFMAPHYRDVSALLAAGQAPLDIMLHALAKRGDLSGAGRQMYAHWGDRKRNIVTLSSPQPNHILHGVGIALASQLRAEDAVTVIAFGDGSTSKGDFHEGLNFAGIHKLPCVFICENNGFSISVPQSKQMAVPDVAIRAHGYGFEGIVVDGCDPIQVYEVSQAAIARARAGGGPTLIEAKVERLLPHTSNDDDTRYRSREELDRIRQQRDPIPLFRKRLLADGVLSGELVERINADIACEVDEAQRSATAAPAPEAEDTMKHVYAA